MNKNTQNKLKVFMMGIESRYLENRDIFISVNVVFTSGLKKFKAKAIPSGNKLSFNYKGNTEELSLQEINRLLTEESSLYDSIVYTYSERGNIVEISGSDKDVSMKNKASEPESEEQHNTETSSVLNRKYLINHIQARPLLTELGILTKDGKVRNDKIRKYNQIDHYVEILEKDLDTFKGKSIHIVDCGCGKSYLSFVLNYYLTEVKKIKCTFTGIDISPKVIEASEKMADNLGYRNMEFITGDIKTLVSDKKCDVVLSLHACDNATDMALNFGIRNQAGLIIAVPCCHAEMNTKFSYKPFEKIIKHNILKRRMADTLTDGLRCLILESQGYDVTIMEYISPLETPKNLMIKAFRTNKKNQAAEDEVTRLIVALDYAPALYRYLNDLE